MIGLFCRISSLLYGSSAKETCNCKAPTNRSHLICDTAHITCRFTHIRPHLKNDIYTYVFQISLVYICIHILRWYDTAHMTFRVTHIKPDLKKKLYVYTYIYFRFCWYVYVYFSHLYDASHITCDAYDASHITCDASRVVSHI